jgi:hypothetical protein
MAKSFRELRARMSPDAQKAAERKASAMLAEIPNCSPHNCLFIKVLRSFIGQK